MKIFKKVIKAVKDFDAALTEYKTPELSKPTPNPNPNPNPNYKPPAFVASPKQSENKTIGGITMYGLKLFIPFEDLNIYIQNNINEPYQGHTFIPVKAEINEIDLSLDITLLSANAIETNCRYKLDLNKLPKEE